MLMQHPQYPPPDSHLTVRAKGKWLWLQSDSANENARLSRAGDYYNYYNNHIMATHFKTNRTTTAML